VEANVNINKDHDDNKSTCGDKRENNINRRACTKDNTSRRISTCCSINHVSDSDGSIILVICINIIIILDIVDDRPHFSERNAVGELNVSSSSSTVVVGVIRCISSSRTNNIRSSTVIIIVIVIVFVIDDDESKIGISIKIQ
jgi:hypothetical protein